MKNITFRQFMIAHDFRWFNDKEQGENAEDTKIIRIHYSVDENFNYRWFEFGIKDYEVNYIKLETINQIFSDFILDMYIYCFSVNCNTNTLEVYLTNEKETGLYD